MKAFIFDMDGLMFDTERVFIGAWDYAGEKMGLGKAGFMLYRTLGMNTPACEQAWACWQAPREGFCGVSFGCGSSQEFIREVCQSLKGLWWALWSGNSLCL